MEESDKHQLEGLLQARSDDLRHRRRPRNRRAAMEIPDVAQADGAARPQDRPAAERLCSGCGVEIEARRIRAMPRATLCLGCRRAAEQAAPAS